MGRSLTAMAIDLSDLLVQPVAGKEDVFAFRYDFVPEGKAVDGEVEPVVQELEDGDLLIEGFAADFTGIDRESENFAPGAFQRGIEGFLSGQAALCYHHKHDKVLGKVLHLEEVEGKGLKMRARVDGAIRNHPELGTIYSQIKNQSINALSVGGIFKRKLTDDGWRISDCDFTEVSCTAVPVHVGTKFSVIAGKALEDAPEPEPEVDTTAAVAALESAQRLVAALEGKALPANYNPSVARDLQRFLTALGKVRETATSLRQYGEEISELDRNTTQEESLGSLADAVETGVVKWEADTHKLAAKYGPLPTPPDHDGLY